MKGLKSDGKRRDMCWPSWAVDLKGLVQKAEQQSLDCRSCRGSGEAEQARTRPVACCS